MADAADPLHDLATRIYVELVARNVDLSSGSVKMAVTPANMAILSVRLSEAFLQAEAEASAARAPVKTYQVATDDIAKWST